MPKPSAKSSKKLKTVIASMQCTICKRINYRSSKNKLNTPERLELSKYCKHDKVTTLHRETK